MTIETIETINLVWACPKCGHERAVESRTEEYRACSHDHRLGHSDYEWKNGLDRLHKGVAMLGVCPACSDPRGMFTWGHAGRGKWDGYETSIIPVD